MCIKLGKRFSIQSAMNNNSLKEFCIEKKIEIRLNEPMSNHTSLKIGGIADIVIFPDEGNMPEIIKILSESGIPYIAIGRGTNLLVRENGIDGAVIFTNKMNKIINITDNGRIIAQAGCSLQKIVSLSVELGFAGMEGLAGIPGSIGGAIAGNAGSFGYEIKDIVDFINIISPDGSIRLLLGSEAGFTYRGSNIPLDSIITSSCFSLKIDDPVSVNKKTKEYLNEKRLKQPLSQASAGCVFKNHDAVPAGKIIGEAGCRGMSIGGIQVSRLHANYFINNNGGSADDFLMLMDIVSKSVKDRFNIILEPEIKIIGRN